MSEAKLPKTLINLNGRVALITGSGGGVGRQLALRMAEFGAHVIINGRREEKCRETEELIRAEGGACSVMAGDVSDKATTERIVAQAEDLHGRLDIVVNNAAIVRVGWFDVASEEDWDEVMRINVKAPYLMSRAAIPLMRKNKFGRIINIGSEGSLIGQVGITSYVTSKAALQGLTINLAQECAIWARQEGGDYTVNLVHPGFNPSEMQETLNEDQYSRILEKVPLRRLGRSREELGSVVSFLATEHASYVTGVKFSAGGGFGMCIAS